MMETDAWKDLEEYIKEQRESSMKMIDNKSAKDLSLGEVCEERGIRKGLIKILNHAQTRKDGEQI